MPLHAWTSAITIAGGYGANIDDTVTAHVNTVRVAGEMLAGSRPAAPPP